MVDACARNGQMEKVPELLAGMKERKLEPNLITYSTMIKGFCQRGDMPAAFNVLEDLKKDLPNNKPDEVVFNTLLDGCAQSGLAAEGEWLLREMQAQDIQPSNYTLTVMVKLMGQSRRLKEKKLLEKISNGFKETKTGLKYIILKKGEGKKPFSGDLVKVHYKGELLDGTVFDSSYKRDQPIEFKVGEGQVIPGWDEGIMLLDKGDKARFIIPSHLAYGENGAGGVIPPNATLIFEVELV
jgi:pentatricopeptide repeat protein